MSPVSPVSPGSPGRVTSGTIPSGVPASKRGGGFSVNKLFVDVEMRKAEEDGEAPPVMVGVLDNTALEVCEPPLPPEKFVRAAIEDAPVIPGWKKLVSPPDDGAQMFFHHEVSGQSKWEHPATDELMALVPVFAAGRDAVAMAMSDIDQDLAKDLAYWVGPCYKHGVEYWLRKNFPTDLRKSVIALGEAEHETRMGNVPAQRTAVFKIRQSMLSKWLKQYDDYIYFEEQKVAVGVVQRAWAMTKKLQRRHRAKQLSAAKSGALARAIAWSKRRHAAARSIQKIWFRNRRSGWTKLRMDARSKTRAEDQEMDEETKEKTHAARKIQAWLRKVLKEVIKRRIAKLLEHFDDDHGVIEEKPRASLSFTQLGWQIHQTIQEDNQPFSEGSRTPSQRTPSHYSHADDGEHGDLKKQVHHKLGHVDTKVYFDDVDRDRDATGEEPLTPRSPWSPSLQKKPMEFYEQYMSAILVEALGVPKDQRLLEIDAAAEVSPNSNKANREVDTEQLASASQRLQAVWTQINAARRVASVVGAPTALVGMVGEPLRAGSADVATPPLTGGGAAGGAAGAVMSPPGAAPDGNGSAHPPATHAAGEHRFSGLRLGGLGLSLTKLVRESGEGNGIGDEASKVSPKSSGNAPGTEPGAASAAAAEAEEERLTGCSTPASSIREDVSEGTSEDSQPLASEDSVAKEKVEDRLAVRQKTRALREAIVEGPGVLAERGRSSPTAKQRAAAPADARGAPRPPQLSVLPPPPPAEAKRPPAWRKLAMRHPELGTLYHPDPDHPPVWRRPPPKYVRDSMAPKERLTSSSLGEDIPMWKKKLQRPKAIKPGNQADYLGIPRPKVERPAPLDVAHSTDQVFRSVEAAVAGSAHGKGLVQAHVPWWASSSDAEGTKTFAPSKTQDLTATQPLGATLAATRKFSGPALLAPPWRRESRIGFATLREALSLANSQEVSVAGQFCRRYEIVARRTEKIKLKALELPPVVVPAAAEGEDVSPQLSPISPASTFLSESRVDPLRRKGRQLVEA